MLKLYIQFMMMYEWNKQKCAANLKKHKVDFKIVEDFDWVTAIVLEDDREDYGEIRYRAMGLIGINVYALVFTERDEKIRVISLRKATRQEAKYYDRHL